MIVHLSSRTAVLSSWTEWRIWVYEIMLLLSASMERFIRFFAGAQNDRDPRRALTKCLPSERKRRCAQGKCRPQRRTGIVSALVKEKVEMCARTLPPGEWIEDSLRTCRKRHILERVTRQSQILGEDGLVGKGAEGFAGKGCCREGILADRHNFYALIGSCRIYHYICSR